MTSADALSDVRSFFDQRAAHYDDDKAIAAMKIARAVALQMTQTSREHHKVRADIGVGTGQMATHLLGLWSGWGVGIDLSRGMLEVAARSQHLHTLRLVQADAELPPLRPRSIDVLVCLSTLQYLLPGAIGELHRLLRPDGLLVLGECCLHPSDRGAYLRTLLASSSPSRLGVTTESAMVQQVVEAGFINASSTTISYVRQVEGLRRKATLASQLQRFERTLGRATLEDARLYRLTATTLQIPYAVVTAQAGSGSRTDRW